MTSEDRASTSNLVVVPEELRSLETAGSIVWWRLSEGLNLDALTEAWKEAELPEEQLPVAPSPKVAFTRTANALKAPRRLVRPLTDGGVVFLDESEVDGVLHHREAFRAKLDLVGRPVLTFPSVLDDDGSEASAEAATRESFLADYDHHLSQIAQSDVSPWLCRTMEWLEAVALRDTGGVYFVPGFVRGRWEKVVEALRAASRHQVMSVPAMKTAEAASAFLDAARAEAEAEAEKMMAELAAGGLGARALRTRIERGEKVVGKLARYEELLGGGLEALHEKLDHVRASLTCALMTEENTDEK